MILAAPHLLLALRWVPPAFALMGSTATYISAWALIRLLTLPLPERCYRRAEETLYSSYQHLVGFLFETWSGVEVGVCCMATIPSHYPSSPTLSTYFKLAPPYPPSTHPLTLPFLLPLPPFPLTLSPRACIGAVSLLWRPAARCRRERPIHLQPPMHGGLGGGRDVESAARGLRG